MITKWKRRPAASTLGELEEEQVGGLLDVVAITDPRVLEDVGVVPDFGDDGG